MMKNIDKLETTYDEVPYMSKTFYNTQPGKLKSNLKLLDFVTPSLEEARVLEIGCSFGGNIIPFALAYPNSKVVGLDLSKVQVDEGNKVISSLGIKNIRLYHKNILDYDGEFGEFDYIICHGVYSWVPNEVQDAIIRVIKKYLSKNGAAVISYNTYPGWKRLEIAREAMIFRDKYLSKRGIEINSKNKVAFGKGVIEFLIDYSHQNDRVKNGLKEILDKNDYYILHEYFEVYNKPLYIYEFAEKLQENGLIHIVDSQFRKSFPVLEEDIEKKIQNDCGNDYIAKEQYNDYIFDNQFRTSIITHAENLSNINISKDIKISNLKELFYRGKFSKNEKGNYVIQSGENIGNNVVKVLDILNTSYPKTITIDEIAKKLVEKNEKIELREIAIIIVNLIYSQEIEIFNTHRDFKFQEKLDILPRYRKYLEYFSAVDNPIISFSSVSGLTYNNENFRLMATMMLLYDGKKTDRDILEILKEKEKSKEITVTISNEKSLEDTLKEYIVSLRKMIEENFFNIEI